MSLPPNKNLLKEFSNRIYVETGIWRGDSIQLALDAGFEQVIGIDNDPESIKFCTSRFFVGGLQLDERLQLVEGDSARCLWEAMRNVDERCTILLDAHWQLLEGTERGEHPFPLMLELEQLAQHPIKKHTIIVDDLLYMTHPNVTGWSLPDLIRKIKKINENYTFKLIANPVIDNMLVAWIR